MRHIRLENEYKIIGQCGKFIIYAEKKSNQSLELVFKMHVDAFSIEVNNDE